MTSSKFRSPDFIRFIHQSIYFDNQYICRRALYRYYSLRQKKLNFSQKRTALLRYILPAAYLHRTWLVAFCYKAGFADLESNRTSTFLDVVSSRAVLHIHRFRSARNDYRRVPRAYFNLFSFPISLYLRYCPPCPLPAKPLIAIVNLSPPLSLYSNISVFRHYSSEWDSCRGIMGQRYQSDRRI